MIDPRVTTYVDAAIAQLRRLDLMRCPGKLPAEMIDEAIPPSNDWIGWKPIASKVTDADLGALERETKLAFPPLYRDFLKYRHFVGLTETGVRFEPHRSDNWQETLRRAYFQSWPRDQIIDRGLLPFGDESFADAGPLCFNTRLRRADGDCPVVFWDHEWQGTEKETCVLFSSCAKMFECLALIAQSEIDFIYHGEGDDDALLPTKRQRLQEFLAKDPLGAGNPENQYWTAWGILSQSSQGVGAESRSENLEISFPVRLKGCETLAQYCFAHP